MVQNASHPAKSLVWLLVLMVAGSLVVSILSILVALVATGVSDLSQMEALLSGQSGDMTFLKIVQAGSTIGTFILPPVMLALIEKNRSAYLRFEGPLDGKMLGIVLVLILFAAMPLLELSGQLNQNMSLPDSMSGIERWMYNKEKQLEELTVNMLSVSTLSGLLFNIFVIAVLPALGEELFFRGGLQTILHRWTRNPHVAIWVIAVVFSAFHMQFYGFLPRLLLSALFGYLFYWSNNLWYPILAHFLNNAAAVIFAFYLYNNGESIVDASLTENFHPLLYVLSAVLTIYLLYTFRRRYRKRAI